jgi:hypothetical protein
MPPANNEDRPNPYQSSVAVGDDASRAHPQRTAPLVASLILTGLYSGRELGSDGRLRRSGARFRVLEQPGRGLRSRHYDYDGDHHRVVLLSLETYGFMDQPNVPRELNAVRSELARIIHVGWRQGRADPWWGSQAGFLVGITLLHAAVRHLRPKSHQAIGLLGPPYQVMNNPAYGALGRVQPSVASRMISQAIVVLA